MGLAKEINICSEQSRGRARVPWSAGRGWDKRAVKRERRLKSLHLTEESLKVVFGLSDKIDVEDCFEKLAQSNENRTVWPKPRGASLT